MRQSARLQPSASPANRCCSATAKSNLKEQLQKAEKLSGLFNLLAQAPDVAEINLEELRNSLQSEIDNQVSVWINLARVEALGQFGTVEQMQAAMDRLFVLCEPRAAPGGN
jgi:hypothetical protein